MTRLPFALLVLVSAFGNPSIQPVSGKVPILSQPTSGTPLSGSGGRDLQVGRSETADAFAIYLVAEPVDGRIIGYGKGDWSHLRLSDSPLIAAADIVSYDFSKHIMRLRPEALAKIPDALSKAPRSRGLEGAPWQASLIHGIPFVVVANGQRIYLGVFSTALSSFWPAVPCILIDGRSLDPTQPEDALVIRGGRGGDSSSSSGSSQDPRGDERIRTALWALHKVKSDRQEPPIWPDAAANRRRTGRPSSASQRRARLGWYPSPGDFITPACVTGMMTLPVAGN